ncbi:hypothetical protein Bca4012_006959 [Brassica carinata]
MSIVIVHFLQQEEAQKATNEHLAALAVVLAPPAGHTSNPPTIRRQLFKIDGTAREEEPTAGTTVQTVGGAVQNPNLLDLATIREIAELKLSLQDIHSKIHHVTSSFPQMTAPSPQHSKPRSLGESILMYGFDLQKSSVFHHTPARQTPPTM